MIPTGATFAWGEVLALVRGKFPFVWFLVLPAVVSAILGRAIALLKDGSTGRVVIGFAVMFSYMSVNYVGRALYREFEAHTWCRTAIARPPNSSFLVGKCLPVLLFTIGQLTVFTTYAVVALDLPLPAGGAEGALQLALIIVALALTGVATGALMYTFIRRAEIFFSLTYLVLMVFASTGGALVPSEHLPGWSQAIGNLTPHYWAMRALDEATLGAARWSIVVEGALALMLYACLLLGLASRRLDLRRECYAV